MLLPHIAKALINRAIYSAVSDQALFTLTTELMPKELDDYIEKNIIRALSRSMAWKTNYVYDRKDAFTRGDGCHVFMIGKVPVLLSVGKQGGEDVDGGNRRPSIGSKDPIYSFSVPRPFKKVLMDLMGSFVTVVENTASIEYVSSRYYNRNIISPKFAEQEQFIGEDTYEKIDEAFRRMLSRDWYEKHNKDFKETLLLEGPPGTGKSTLMQHFVSKYQFDTYVIKPEDYAHPSVRIGNLRNGKPKVIIIEEIDACKALCKPDPLDKDNWDPSSDFNYADFINWLNGLTPLDNIIVLMTTNHKEKLIEALYRNGRVDRRIHVPYLTTDQLIGYIGEKWAEQIKSYPAGRITVSMITELRAVETEEEFHALVELLSEISKPVAVEEVVEAEAA